MKFASSILCGLLLVALVCLSAGAQQTATQSVTTAIVPRLMNFSGRATDPQGKPIFGIAGVTFAIYKDQSEGTPLWMETHNVQADARGNYSVQLGAGKSGGLPLELFSSGAARWLGVRVNDQQEQPRVLLLSVPYALKAADAETVGGLPASAFVLAAPAATNGSVSSLSSVPPSSSIHNIDPNLGGSGTQNYLPLWTDNAGTLGNSVFYQVGSGTTAKIGLNLKNPLATLDVNGTTLVRGTLEAVTKGYATASKGYNSNPLDVEASSFSSTAHKAVMQHFEWQAEPTGNNTSSPGATLNLLFGQDDNKPAETGLKLSKTGVFTFAPGQAFPGAGTVTSVGLAAPSSDFTVSGSPITKNGTLGLNWKVAPTAANTANAIVKRDGSGSFNSGAIVATSTGVGVWGETSGAGGGADGVHGVAHSPGSGVAGVNDNPSGVGVWAQGVGLGLYGTSSASQAIWGESFASNYSNGSGPDGVHGVAHSNIGSGVGGINWADGGVGVWGEAPTGFGFYTPNNVQQGRTAGGWLKAMIVIDGASNTILRCFNSTLAGAAATTTPCGFSDYSIVNGAYVVDFGFDVSDRFVSVTPKGYYGPESASAGTQGDGFNGLLASQVKVIIWNNQADDFTDDVFHLLVY